MPDFEPRQIFIVHEALWQAMEDFAAQHNFHLHRVPDGSDDSGRLMYVNDGTTTPTYAFMPKEI